MFGPPVAVVTRVADCCVEAALRVKGEGESGNRSRSGRRKRFASGETSYEKTRPPGIQATERTKRLASGETSYGRGTHLWRGELREDTGLYR